MILLKIFCLQLVLADTLRMRRSTEIKSAAQPSDPPTTTTPNPYTYSVTSNIISDLLYPATPTYYGSQAYSPSPFYGSSTPSMYPTVIPYHKPIFAQEKDFTTEIHVKSLPIINPYAATLSPEKHYYPTPRSNIPIAYSAIPSFLATPRHSSPLHLHPLSPGYRYNPPALTFLDKQPISQAIQVKHRSFTPQPRIREPESQDVSVPKLVPNIPANNPGPPQPALITIGLQSKPTYNNNEEPAVPADNNYNVKDTIESDDIQMKLTDSENISTKLIQSFSESVDNAAKETTTEVSLHFPQNVLSEISALNASEQVLTTEPFSPLNTELEYSEDSSDTEVPINAKNANINQSENSTPTHTDLTISSDESEAELARHNSDIFSDPSLYLDSRQDVPRSPAEELSLTDSGTIPPGFNLFPSSVQENFRIVKSNDVPSKVIPRPVRIKIPSQEGRAVVNAQPVQTESDEQTHHESEPFADNPALLTFEDPRTFSENSNLFDDRIIPADKSSAGIHNPSTDSLTPNPHQNSVTDTFQHQQNRPFVQQLLRNPSDYIFQPSRTAAPISSPLTQDFLSVRNQLFQSQQSVVPDNVNFDQVPVFEAAHFPETPALQQNTRFQTQFNSDNSFVLDNPPFSVQSQPQQPAGLTTFNTDTFNPVQESAFPVFSDQREQKSFPPLIGQQNTFHPTDPKQNEITQDQGQQTLFQRINKQAVDRPARTKQPKVSSVGSEPNSFALEALLGIAGPDWDISLHEGKTILSTSSSSFDCPSLAGDYPDPDKCDVYYQCAEGVAHMHTCQQGLLYNMVTKMCDWQQNVDCEVNKGNKKAPLIPEVEQVVSNPFTMFGV